MVQKDHPSYLEAHQIIELNHYSARLSEVLLRCDLIRDLPSRSIMYFIGMDRELHGLSCRKIKNVGSDILVKIKGQHRRIPTHHLITADIFNAIKSQALLLGENWPPTPF